MIPVTVTATDSAGHTVSQVVNIALDSSANLFAGIDATGATDVTVPLNVVLASLPFGTVAQFPPGGQYRVEGTLAVVGKDGVTLDGNGSTFFATTNGLLDTTTNPNANRTRSQWRYSSCTRLTVKNMTTKGSSPSTGPNGVYDSTLEAQHAYEIAGCANVLLDHVKASGTWGDLVNIAKGPTNLPSSIITVQDSSFVGCSRQGMSITCADRVTIQRNVIDQSRRSLIDLETNTAADTISFVTIANNTLGDSRFSTVNNGGGSGSSEHDIVVTGNRYIGSGTFQWYAAGPAPGQRFNYTFTNNVGVPVNGTQNDPLVAFQNIGNPTVTGNTGSFAAGAWPTRTGPFGSPQGVVMLVCSPGTVSGNTFTAGVPALIQRCP